jgi:hypothetical protein
MVAWSCSLVQRLCLLAALLSTTVVSASLIYLYHQLLLLLNLRHGGGIEVGASATQSQFPLILVLQA